MARISARQDQGCFGDAVGAVVWPGKEARATRDDNDAPGPACRHTLHRGIAEAQCAHDVSLQGAAPDIGIELPDRPYRIAKSGVGDEQANSAQSCFRFGDDALDVCLHGHVGRHRDRLAACLLDSRNRFVQLRRRARRDRDGCTRLRQANRDGLTEAPAATCDNRYLTAQLICHRALHP